MRGDWRWWVVQWLPSKPLHWLGPALVVAGLAVALVGPFFGRVYGGRCAAWAGHLREVERAIVEARLDERDASQETLAMRERARAVLEIYCQPRQDGRMVGR